MMLLPTPGLEMKPEARLLAMTLNIPETTTDQEREGEVQSRLIWDRCLPRDRGYRRPRRQGQTPTYLGTNVIGWGEVHVTSRSSGYAPV